MTMTWGELGKTGASQDLRAQPVACPWLVLRDIAKFRVALVYKYAVETPG